MYICALNACLVPLKARKGHEIPSGTRDTDSCKLPCESWNLTLHLLQEQSVLLVDERFPSPFSVFLRVSSLGFRLEVFHNAKTNAELVPFGH